MSVSFRPQRGVFVAGPSGTGASASLDGIEVSCPSKPRRHFVDPESVPRYSEKGGRTSLHEAAELTCSAEGELEFSSHPIWGDGNRIVGAAVVVATRPERELVVAGSIRRDMYGGKTYSHLSYTSRFCAQTAST